VVGDVDRELVESSESVLGTSKDRHRERVRDKERWGGEQRGGRGDRWSGVEIEGRSQRLVVFTYLRRR